MKKGETISVTIDRLDAKGIGTGTVSGRVVSVSGTVPGDRVRAEIIQIKRHSARGKLVSVDTPGVERIPPRCPHFAVCGGCRWQDIPYPAQLRMKVGMIRTALTGVDGYQCPDDIPITLSPDVFCSGLRRAPRGFLSGDILQEGTTAIRL